jgi:hypothetical protein
MKKRKRVGSVHFHFYELPDDDWEVRVAAGKNDIPDPKVDLRGYVKMSLLTAQLAAYAKEQALALDFLLKENKAIQQEKKEAGQYQMKLPFEKTEEENG